MRIREVKRFSKKLYASVSGLLPQLDPGIVIPAEEHFRSILKSDQTHLFIAETDTGVIAGILTVAIYDIPTGKKVWIEDVVVDKSFRGKGLGRNLLDFAIDFAARKGAKSVDLTSRPSRVEANRLYKDMGFVLRETNMYRFVLK